MIATIFDVETTGLISNRTKKLELQPSVIEIYMASVNLKTGKIGKTFGTFIKPPKPLSDTPAFGDKKTIEQITGISNQMLEGAPTFAEVHEQIFKMVERSKVLIAHNAAFDTGMLSLEAERLKYDLKFPRILCTVESSVHHKGYRLNLTNLHKELFGEPFEGAHRAKDDVKALIRCSVEMFKRGWL